MSLVIQNSRQSFNKTICWSPTLVLHDSLVKISHKSSWETGCLFWAVPIYQTVVRDGSMYIIIHCFLNLSLILSAAILTLIPRSLIKILDSANPTITVSLVALLKHPYSILILLWHLHLKIPQMDSTNSVLCPCR